MTRMAENRGHICPSCGGKGYAAVGNDGAPVRCDMCSAIFTTSPDGTSALSVSGHSPTDVSTVLKNALPTPAPPPLAVARREEHRLSSPYFSGFFYLLVAVVFMVAVTVMARAVSPWAFPVALGGALLLLMVVGALQMRQDDKLSERGFLKLMGDVLGRLPSVLRPSKAEHE